MPHDRLAAAEVAATSVSSSATEREAAILPPPVACARARERQRDDDPNGMKPALQLCRIDLALIADWATRKEGLLRVHISRIWAVSP